MRDAQIDLLSLNDQIQAIKPSSRISSCISNAIAKADSARLEHNSILAQKLTDGLSMNASAPTVGTLGVGCSIQ
jgi:hypothetical protein